MLLSDGPSNSDFWTDPVGFLAGGDGFDDSDKFSMSAENILDILNEDQARDPSAGTEDKSPYSNELHIPLFPENPSSENGLHQHQPWSLSLGACQAGFGPWSPSNNLKSPFLAGNNEMECSFMPFDGLGRYDDVYIGSLHEDSTPNKAPEPNEKPIASFESSDSYAGPLQTFEGQVYKDGLLNIPEQDNFKRLVTSYVYPETHWLSLSSSDPDEYSRIKMETSVLPTTSGCPDNHLCGGSLNHIGNSKFDAKDMGFMSDPGCLVDLTQSDSDDDNILETGKFRYKGFAKSAGDLNYASVSKNIRLHQSVEHKSTSLKEGIQNIGNIEKVSFRSGPKSILDDNFFVRETSGMSFMNISPKLSTSATSSPGSSAHMEDDTDICFVEDATDRRHNPPVASVQNKIHATSQPPLCGDSFNLIGMGDERVRTYDEKLTYRLALQDLSQPIRETSPPDGVLAVPLLRHQRIALSWMLHKETASLHCSGGILADDQGLGKTVSTIALILMEKSPSLNSNSKVMANVKPEALDLDDDDGWMKPDGPKLIGNSENFVPNPRPLKTESSNSVCKGRPAAGTLVVCPTSVLRQWAEELQNKVTDKAKLSVLTYHGSNRTRDPSEVAKYDVVLTTYSIVSMEVPKQPFVDQDDEKRDNENNGSHVDLCTNKKRKQPLSEKKNKGKKAADGSMSDPSARPLARVAWFRVVLDEAQTIKNHRTQVARACWGLRAKRRWCLSGTPIQNAIDDLYSYFRFLRYDPYAVYKSFCTSIKNPISRNPVSGYKKLQAVLQIIMLRRTKGTFIDGEPIIKLPPKSISLKKVDFSRKERDFYSRLEADSRAQFKVYADAGTVKQNYVNILLMLLRLRQACDHPNLVKGFDSGSAQRFALESAKKLPQEKRKELLSYLEACQSLCGICNDPPEDASITICGHVFCNQCICELLSGDENICPVSHCKTQISISSVFSRTALTSSISDEFGQNNVSDESGLEHDEMTESHTGISSESSKIRATLELLQSLPVVQQTNVESSSDVHTPEVNLHGESACVSVPSEQSSTAMVGRPTEKAIIFSQWTRMLDLLEVSLKNSGIQYRRLDGTMSVLARDKAVKDFNTLPEVSVMIMSLKAASLGLNMVAACHVLLLDLWWNPTTEDQAIDRAHRIGQTRPVSVTRLTIKDTVEDRILALQEKKRIMVASAFGEDERGGRQTRLTEDDLKYLFMI